jgi:hypothetical protein
MFVYNSKIFLSALVFALCIQSSSEAALIVADKKNQKHLY